MKLRVLLVNPWIYDFTAFDLWSKPIGLLYIASYLRSLGYEIDYIDCLDRYHPAVMARAESNPLKPKKYGVGHFQRQRVEKPAVFHFVPRYFARYGMPEEVFISCLKRLKTPAAVLITSFMTYWYPGPQRVIEILREVFPRVPVILGGIYATLLPEHARSTLKPDFVITGAGEVQVDNLLSELLPAAPRNSLTFRSLDDFPTPAFDLYRHAGCPTNGCHSLGSGAGQRQRHKLPHVLMLRTTDA